MIKVLYFAGLREALGTAAEELVQETMLAVWSKAETFDPRRATVSTWIFTIVRNKRIDMFRRQGYPGLWDQGKGEKAFFCSE